MTVITPTKQRGRPFAAGTSGNPRGKPRGARHRTTVIAEQLMESDAAEIVASVIQAAKAGDMVAARIVLDRIAPIRRGRPLSFSMPPIATADDAARALATIAAAMADGELTIEEASGVVAVIDAARRSIETCDLEKRILALEGTTK